MGNQTGPVPPGAPDLLLTLERGGQAPLHEQVEQALREQIRSGRLMGEAALPSSRALARQLGVSRGVVVEAYAQLSAEGYLISTQGAPTRVAPTASTERPPVPATSLDPRRLYDFAPGVPDLASFPREQWLRSLRFALRESPFAELGPGDARGAAALRNALMAYLGRVRAAAPEPEHTLICAGFAHGFAALCRVLRDRGLERVAVEAPGSPLHGLVAAAAGLQAVPIAVDELGIDVGALAQSGCEVVLLTPSHQYPTGGVLGPERRAALLEWAEDEDALIVEDDYDSELRYDHVPVGALQGLAPERVCQIGSFSIRLAPGLRLGWMLSPSWLTGALCYELGLAGGAPSAVEQLALCDFTARGELDRHLRRMRGHYRSRRQALAGALERHLPGSRILGLPAGVFALVELGGSADPAAVVRAAAARGVAVQAADGQAAGGQAAGGQAAVGPAADGQAADGQVADGQVAGGQAADGQVADGQAAGLVLGYANLAEPAIERGIELLARAVCG